MAARNGNDNPRGVDGATPSPGLLPDTSGDNGGGNGGGSSPGTPLLGRHQGPDPRAGRRVSVRPQPTRAPRREAMALDPLWGRGAARTVARVPTRQWGVGGTVGGTAAAALRLPLSPGVAGAAAGGPPPPRGEMRPGGQPGNEHRVPGDRRQQRACRPPTPRGPCPSLLPSAPTASAQLTETAPAVDTTWAEAARPQPAARRPRLTCACGAKTTAPPRLAVACRPHPVSMAVGMAAVPAPAPYPPGEASVSGPPHRPEGAYSPRAHEGAPVRDEGSGSSLGGGCRPGSGEGPMLLWGVGGATGRTAAAAPRLPLTPGAAGSTTGLRPPPPPSHRDTNRGRRRSHPPARRRRAAAPPDASLPAARRVPAWMGHGPGSLTVAQQDLTRKLTCRHAWPSLWPWPLSPMTCGGDEGGGCCPPPPPVASAAVRPPPPPTPDPPPPLLLMRCGDVEPHPGPVRLTLANVTSLWLHWHTVAEWWADVDCSRRPASRRWHSK